MTTVDLSVFLANYNHARYLPRALDAVLTQRARAREVIVIDDASTDDSPRILADYARRYDNVRFVRNERNRGVVPNYNTGTDMARGKYLFLGAVDDYVLPGFFEKACAQLDATPHAGLCCAYDSFKQGDDGEVVPAASGWCTEPTYFTPNEVADKLRFTLGAHATICRREVMVKAGGYLPKLAWYSDWFAYLVIAFRTGICHIPEVLAIRTLGLPEQYSAEAGKGEMHVQVLGALLDCLTSAEYADVAPLFRRKAVVANFGPDLVRAAARRADSRDPQVLAWISGFAPETYEALLGDADPEVRELAGHFLGEFWRSTQARRIELEVEVDRLREELERTRHRLPPPGAVGKLRWLAGLVAKRIRRAA